jgi:NSS family neurotransmitter:Na+ symporter
VGGVAIAIVGGWLVAKDAFLGELAKGGRPARHDGVVYALVRFVAPVLILLILLNSLGVIRLA